MYTYVTFEFPYPNVSIPYPTLESNIRIRAKIQSNKDKKLSNGT